MDIIMLELERIFEDLLVRIEMYNDGEINYQINEIKKALTIIQSDMDLMKKTQELREIQKNIYPPRGGLSDFYVWRNDESERIAINKPISELGDSLWNLLKEG